MHFLLSKVTIQKDKVTSFHALLIRMYCSAADFVHMSNRTKKEVAWPLGGVLNSTPCTTKRASGSPPNSKNQSGSRGGFVSFFSADRNAASKYAAGKHCRGSLFCTAIRLAIIDLERLSLAALKLHQPGSGTVLPLVSSCFLFTSKVKKKLKKLAQFQFFFSLD